MVVSCVETEVKRLVLLVMDITFLVGEEGDRRTVQVVGWINGLEFMSRLETFMLSTMVWVHGCHRSSTIFVWRLRQRKIWLVVFESIVHNVILNLLFVVLLFRDDSLLSNYVLCVAVYREQPGT